MPPVRVAPESKPSRYERTRLENQERSVKKSFIAIQFYMTLTTENRAYIAASRRTDRGLNARMQSARRASEIHQKRTGRALRVTEVEVLNEALYEEITDVSTQRRRWRAHLHTQSEDFDRSLLTFMTNQLAAHDALDQAVAGTWLEEQRDAAAGFLNPGIMHLMPSPHQTIDVSASNFQHTPYLPGSWQPRSEDYTYQAPMAPPNEYTYDEQPRSPSDPAWLDLSRRMSLPITFTQPLYSPIWPSTPASNCSTSPLKRVHSTVDHMYHPSSNDNFQQTASSHQSQKPTVNTTPQSLSPTLSSENHELPTANPYSLGHGTNKFPAASPRHDFTDRRYSYNPNGKPKSTPSSSIQSPSVPYTPCKSLNFDIQTPASFKS
jgi:hypothetical protein